MDRPVVQKKKGIKMDKIPSKLEIYVLPIYV